MIVIGQPSAQTARCRGRTSTGRASAMFWLAYKSVAARGWTKVVRSPKWPAVGGLAENIRAQDRIALRRRSRRMHGALSLTIQARPIFDDGHLRGLDVERRTAPRRSSKTS